MTEDKIIKELYKSKSKNLDDCFFFDGKYLVTTDTICELTHFKHEWSTPSNIANKLIEVNVSDICASGGIPKYAFLNLGLSKISEQKLWLQSFIKQLKKTLSKYNIQLAGGDTYKSKTTNLTLTLIGTSVSPVFRNTGVAGDYIYLTGSVGLSNLGYQVLKNNLSLPVEIKKKALNKHLNPVARMEEAKQLHLKYVISAMMDITDGLIQDCEKLSVASNLNFDIFLEKLPDFSLYHKYSSIDEILYSGEELELLFLSKSIIPNLRGCKISCIGRTSKKNQSVDFFLNNKKYIPKKKGFLHFK